MSNHTLIESKHRTPLTYTLAAPSSLPEPDLCCTERQTPAISERAGMFCCRMVGLLS